MGTGVSVSTRAVWCRLAGCGVWEMRVGCRGCVVGLGDFTRLVPNKDPSSEEELGRDWPLWRDGQSRLEGVLRRMWGLLMMDPCKREDSQISRKKVKVNLLQHLWGEKTPAVLPSVVCLLNSSHSSTTCMSSYS